MTHAQAKQVFATHMQASRKRKLAPYELKQLSIARQALRSQRKPVANKRSPKGMVVTKRRNKSNPAQPVLIYGAVKRIEAVKTQNHICDAECKACGHRYFHDFSSRPKMYGLPDGSLLIKS